MCAEIKFIEKAKQNAAAAGAGDEMRRWIGMLLCVCLMIFGAAGCSTEKDGNTDGRSEVEFTVVNPDKIPEELAQEIENNKQGEIRMSYTDGGKMYLVRGYGEQKTGGYSISVVECTENENEIYLDTRLLGPANQDQISKEPSYPCLVLMIEAREKEVKIQ